MLSPAMADGALLQTFDHALRGGAMVLQLLIATLLIRHHARSLAARLGAAFALGVAAYAVCSWPGFAAHAVIWFAPILAICIGNSLVFWLFARALFDDDFAYRWWHAAAWVALATVGLLEVLLLIPGGFSLAGVVGIVLSLSSLAFAALAVGQTLLGVAGRSDRGSASVACLRRGRYRRLHRDHRNSRVGASRWPAAGDRQCGERRRACGDGERHRLAAVSRRR
jgi:hypothetical protein